MGSLLKLALAVLSLAIVTHGDEDDSLSLFEECPSGWILFGEVCYKVSSGTMQWFAAQQVDKQGCTWHA